MLLQILGLTRSSTTAPVAWPSDAVAKLAAEIVSGGASVAQRGAAETVVRDWLKEVKVTHDPLATLAFMTICSSLADNPGVKGLLKEGNFATVEAVVTAVSGLLGGRQIIQAWSNHADDVAARADAWTIFLQGLEALNAKPPQLFHYLDSCLAHDKGYGQIYLATQDYLLMATDEVVTEADFPTVLRKMLASDSNTSIWMGGMKGSGRYDAQLKRGPDLDAPNGKNGSDFTLEKQEGNMWSRVVTQMFDCYNPAEKDWGYAATLGEKRGDLFAAVQKASSGYTLHPGLLDGALELLGV